MKLDRVDRDVLGALRADGRATAQSIAETIGISPSTARARLRRLLDEGAVRVHAIPDPAAFGAPLAYFAHFDIASTPDEALASVTAVIPNIDFLVLLDDSTRIAFHATATTFPHLSSVLDDLRRSAAPKDLLVEVVLRTHPGGPRSAGLPFTGEFELDDVDRVLAQELETDGRRSFTALADVSGLSVPATRERVLRLIKSRAIQFDTILDHASLGMQGLAGLGVRIEGSMLDFVPRILSIGEVAYAVEVTGSFDLRVELICRDEAHLEETLGAIRKLPGSVGVSVHPYSAMVVNTGIWL